MGTSNDVERIAAPACECAGLELVDVEIRSGNLVITVDREGGVDLDTLGRVSKAISTALDHEDAGPSGHYELEVSSPGLERRLRRPDHFQRFVGHDVAVKTKAGVEGDRRFEGRIATADERSMIVTGAGLPEGGRRINYRDIERAHTVFDWRAALAGSSAPTTRSDRREGSEATRASGGTTHHDVGREMTETA